MGQTLYRLVNVLIDNYWVGWKELESSYLRPSSFLGASALIRTSASFFLLFVLPKNSLLLVRGMKQIQDKTKDQ